MEDETLLFIMSLSNKLFYLLTNIFNHAFNVSVNKPLQSTYFASSTVTTKIKEAGMEGATHKHTGIKDQEWDEH